MCESAMSGLLCHTIETPNGVTPFVARGLAISVCYPNPRLHAAAGGRGRRSELYRINGELDSCVAFWATMRANKLTSNGRT